MVVVRLSGRDGCLQSLRFLLVHTRISNNIRTCDIRTGSFAEGQLQARRTRRCVRLLCCMVMRQKFHAVAWTCTHPLLRHPSNSNQFRSAGPVLGQRSALLHCISGMAFGMTSELRRCCSPPEASGLFQWLAECLLAHAVTQV